MKLRKMFTIEIIVILIYFNILDSISINDFN